MTKTQCFLTVLISSLLFAFLGGGVGLALGRFTPGYYRALYSSGDSATFNPVEVGLGLGVTQGLAGGALIGVLILFAVGQRFPQWLQEFVRKQKKILAVVSLVLLLLLGVAYWYLLQLGDSLAAHAYTDFISSDYIPTMKRSKGQWPRSLNGLVKYIKSREDYSRSGGFYNDVLRFHRSSFDRFQPLESDAKEYSYILHFNGRKVKCTSDRDEGSCTYLGK